MPIERAFAYLHAANVANGARCRWAVPDLSAGSHAAAPNAAELTFAALQKRHAIPVDPTPE